MLDNGGIQPISIVYSVHVCYILGTTSRPVGVAYHLVYSGACLFTVHSYVAMVTFYLELRLVWLILIPIRTLGGWDWPGVSAMAYLYVFVDCFIHRRLVPIL